MQKIEARIFGYVREQQEKFQESLTKYKEELDASVC